MNKLATKQAFTLIELIVVIIIIGILAGMLFPQFTRSKEQTMDKQARAILQTIRAAERAYRIDTGTYYPRANVVESLSAINQNLSLDLVDNGDWGYSIQSNIDGDTFLAELNRSKGGYARKWIITETEETPNCSPVSALNWCP